MDWIGHVSEGETRIVSGNDGETSMKIEIEISDRAMAEDIISRLIDIDIGEYGLVWNPDPEDDGIDEQVKKIILDIGKAFGMTEADISACIEGESTGFSVP